VIVYLFCFQTDGAKGYINLHMPIVSIRKPSLFLQC